MRKVDPSPAATDWLFPWSTAYDLYQTAESTAAAFSRYANEFLVPFGLSTIYFNRAELEKAATPEPLEVGKAYSGLYWFNLDLSQRALRAVTSAFGNYACQQLPEIVGSWLNNWNPASSGGMSDYLAAQAKAFSTLAYTYPEAIAGVEAEYGFHFERGGGELISETDRFMLYQVLPSDKQVAVDNGLKPVIIIPPYVLGTNILSFLPAENRSYAHSFANQGIPTYIRIMKDIHAHEAVQVMQAEDDTRDSRQFCEVVMRKHDQPITLNGYCQGGFSSVLNLASGELDGLVDTLITCVSPMDGTCSTGLSAFLKSLPSRFNDLDYGTKLLPNGNRVADGALMGWVYKLKSIDAEFPVVAFLRDLQMFTRQGGGVPGKPLKISKSAAAINYWLLNERTDLPLAITRLSFDSYNTPITSDGTLPVKLFGRRLNLKRLAEKGIRWLICYGENDDLVEKETALAPLAHIDAEVTAFPKGHVAIATSWSNPDSACALHTRFGERQYRGPVRFHLDLAQADRRPATGK